MQDLASRQAADARVRALHGPLLWPVVLAGVAVTVLFTLVILLSAFVVTARPGVLAVEVDFRVFWAAARLALAGTPLDAFDLARLAEVHQVNPTAFMPWVYPPGYQLLILPLGALDFSPAFLAMTLLSVGLMGLAVRPFTAGSLPVWLALTLAPAYVPALILGQNSLLWLAGLLAALALLRAGRFGLAGVCIGCLTLKPQLGLLIPVALLAAGLWRTILTATLTTLVLALVPTLVVGPDYWTALVAAMARQSEVLVASIANLHLMVGPLYLMTLLGLGPRTALMLQGAIMLAAAVLVFLLWRSERFGFDAKAAGLLSAMLLSSPYLWYYETAMLAVIGLFLIRAGRIGRGALSLAFAALLWLGCLLLAANAFLDLADDRLFGAVLITPLLLGCLARLVLDRAASPDPPAKAA